MMSMVSNVQLVCQTRKQNELLAEEIESYGLPQFVIIEEKTKRIVGMK